MNILGSLLSKILGRNPLAVSPSPVAASAPASPALPVTPGVAPAVTPAPAPLDPVDVDAILSELASKHAEKLDWKKSIVDLMKLLGMDSSLAERKELARELNYQGDMSDSAKMNIWLHKQVLQKLSENGGKVPSELLD